MADIEAKYEMYEKCINPEHLTDYDAYLEEMVNHDASWIKRTNFKSRPNIAMKRSLWGVGKKKAILRDYVMDVTDEDDESNQDVDTHGEDKGEEDKSRPEGQEQTNLDLSNKCGYCQNGFKS
ncbi:MAG: hypothetical protein Q9213_006530 [Squamulea squamosa]